jgi:hypothetical protein
MAARPVDGKLELAFLEAESGHSLARFVPESTGSLTHGNSKLRSFRAAISPDFVLKRCTLRWMNRIIQLVLTAGLLSSPALAQTTEPAPEFPTPIVATPAAPEAASPFGVAYEFGINPFVSTFKVDYDVTDNINLRFGISPYPQLLEVGAAYIFRNTPDWRLYGVLGLAYRFDANPALWSRVIGSLAIGLEYPFGFGWPGANRPPIWNRIEFGISSLNDLFGFSYSNAYPGIGLYLRSGIVIRF